MTEVAALRGIGNVTVAHVIERAGVSRRTFYEAFANRDDCFLAALDHAIERVSERILAECLPQTDWRERVRAGLTALLRLLDEEPFVGRLLIVESLGGGRESQERRVRALAPAVAAIDEGRSRTGAGAHSTAMTAEWVVGAVLSVLHTRLSDGAPGGLLELINPLMAMVVLPYRGPAAARRELLRPSVEAVAAEDVARSPLSGLRVRLTYRTMQVLSAVASRPGSSNRAVADLVGISDQGQISKLMARLEKSGLVENAAVARWGRSALRREPNAWQLTERGREVHEVLGTHG